MNKKVVEKKVIDIIKEIVNINEIPDKSICLNEIIKEPIVFYEILEQIESILNIVVNDQNINDNTTIEEFINIIAKETK